MATQYIYVCLPQGRRRALYCVSRYFSKCGAEDRPLAFSYLSESTRGLVIENNIARKILKCFRVLDAKHLQFVSALIRYEKLLPCRREKVFSVVPYYFLGDALIESEHTKFFVSHYSLANLGRCHVDTAANVYRLKCALVCTESGIQKN